jgi:hypothetical protein
MPPTARLATGAQPQRKELSVNNEYVNEYDLSGKSVAFVPVDATDAPKQSVEQPKPQAKPKPKPGRVMMIGPDNVVYTSVGLRENAYSFITMLAEARETTRVDVVDKIINDYAMRLLRSNPA